MLYFDKLKNRDNDEKRRYQGDIFLLEEKLSSEFNIETNLFGAKAIKTKYRFIDSAGMRGLKQEKLINVPLCNGGSETLLQEHMVGSHDYEYTISNSKCK